MEGIKDFFDSNQFPTFYKEKLQAQLKEMDLLIQENISPLRKELKKWKLIIIPFIPIAPILMLVEYRMDIEIFHFFLSKIEYYKKRIEEEKNKIRNQYKFNVLKPCLNKSYSNVEHIVNQRFGTKSIYKSMFFETYLLEIKGEDFMRFYIDDIMLQFSEIHISCAMGASSFRGIFLSVDFPKKFKTSCIIKHEKSKLLKKEKYKPYPWDKKTQKVLHLTELEASPFEKMYKVYSEDPLETRYILSLTTMNRLVEYQKKLNLPVEYSFVDNRMYMRINNKTNMFEPNYKKGNNNIDKLKENLSFISELTDVICDINLDTRIWKV